MEARKNLQTLSEKEIKDLDKQCDFYALQTREKLQELESKLEENINLLHPEDLIYVLRTTKIPFKKHEGKLSYEFDIFD